MYGSRFFLFFYISYRMMRDGVSLLDKITERYITLCGCRPIRPRACVRSRNPGLFACGAVRTFIVSRKEKNIMAKYI